MSRWRDPWWRAVGIVLAVVVAGFVALGFAWHGARHAVYVPLQVPFALSGGLVGLALIGFGLAALWVHLGRRQDAAHRRDWEAFTRDAAELAERLRTGEAGWPRSAVRPRRGSTPRRRGAGRSRL